jgi:hypothetical protein
MHDQKLQCCSTLTEQGEKVTKGMCTSNMVLVSVSKKLMQEDKCTEPKATARIFESDHEIDMYILSFI